MVRVSACAPVADQAGSCHPPRACCLPLSELFVDNAWKFLNDSMTTRLVLRFSSRQLAEACLKLSTELMEKLYDDIVDPDLSRSDTNASRLPSGDHAGLWSSPAVVISGVTACVARSRSNTP